MRTTLAFAAAAVCFACGACTSPMVHTFPSPGRAERISPSFPIPVAPRRPEAILLDTVRTWKPRFVTTGVSTGLMIDYSGMKKGKTPQARYAIVDVWNPAVRPGPRSDTLSSAFVRLFAQINDMGQAFFKLPPGRYVVRHAADWGDDSYVRDLIIRDGSYSLLTIPVLQTPPPDR